MEEICITGIAGRFPECENTEELIEALLKGTDLITVDDRRHKPGLFGTPEGSGKIPYLDKFDASFFGISPKAANFMDPRQRILTETCYEAIIDAGYNPEEIRGSKTGVYVAIVAFANIDQFRQYKTNGYTNLGYSNSLAANRISYVFDLKGPSLSIDTACSSAHVALANAVRDLKNGSIDAALVCGANLLEHPHVSKEFNFINMLSSDGRCRVFSSNRNGFGRSEAIGCVFLQNKSNSRRIYGSILAADTNCDGFKVEGLTFPSAEMQLVLMRNTFWENNIDPDDVVYVEAHGTGTPLGDINEGRSITTMFCEDRSEPLLIGSVKSNMGHSEISSGICSLAKIIGIMNRGIIPANLHSDPLDTTIHGIGDNRLEVVKKNTPFKDGLICSNCFGFGGANATCILKPHNKVKTQYKKPTYRLVCASGRTEEAVNYFLDQVEANRDDEEFLALIDEIHKLNISGHNYRGYILLGEKSKRMVGRTSTDRPIWFIYSGMGSQFLSMGKDLLKIEAFRRTFQRCAAALMPYNIDLMDIVTSTDPSIFDDITNCFVAVAAIQIALTDVLFLFGIRPDGMAGHSLGEVGCAYADGHLTPEEAMLLGFARAYGCQNSTLPTGLMAAVGMSKEEISKILPPGVIIACQNGKQSVTISGLEEPTQTFVAELQSKGIFAKTVNSANIAFHSPYMATASEYLKKFISPILAHPKPRSKKWISSSVTLNQEHENWTKLNCTEYHVNNFRNTVLFDQVYQHIPENAIVIEVAPHGLLQAILKRELGSNTTYLSFADRNSLDNEEFFLSAIGKVFLEGGQPQLRNFYNGVQFPVSRGTKMLSPLVKWNHDISWLTPTYKHIDYYGKQVIVNLAEPEYSHLEGHYVDGRILMPATGYLVLAWEVFAQMYETDMDQLPVVMENIIFKRATVLPQTGEIKFVVNITKQSGNFEIFEGGSVVATGKIRTSKNISNEFTDSSVKPLPKNQYMMLNKEDMYKECHLRKYMYRGMFQGIIEVDVYGNRGIIEWQGKFDSFLDTMLQLTVLQEHGGDLCLPTYFRKVVIDPQQHLKLVTECKEMVVTNNKDMNIIKCGGIEITDHEFSRAPRRQVQLEPILEEQVFVKFKNNQEKYCDFNISLSIATQIILQNLPGIIKRLKICEVQSSDDENLTSKVKEILKTQSFVDAEYFTMQPDQMDNNFDVLLITESVLANMNNAKFWTCLNTNSFVIYSGNLEKIEKSNLEIVFQSDSKSDKIYLMRNKQDIFSAKSAVIHVYNFNYDWLEKVKNFAGNGGYEVVYLVSQGEETTGLIGLTKCLLTEPCKVSFRCVITERGSEKFSLDSGFYKNQLLKNLTFNVLKNNEWGTFVHIPIGSNEKKEVSHASVGLTTIGDLSTLTWVERPSNYFKPALNSEFVYVFNSALNFKDVMVASGQLHVPRHIFPTAPDVNIGLEYSGITTAGKRVMGITNCEGLSLQLYTDPAFTWLVPDSWTLEDAATVPCVYATCYYALIIRGNMKPGESILIHAGSGGIGMAAISIALSMNCEVYTTVSTKEKRDFLRGIFPKLQEKNIGNSRDSTFEKMIMINTKRRGVDLVLNSLSGELFQASVRCLARRGRFLELGKVDFLNRTPLDTNVFLKNCSFHGIFLDDIMEVTSKLKKEIQDLLKKGVETGVVRPLPKSVFTEDQVEQAFRYLSTGKHKGKVLIQIRKEGATISKSLHRTIKAEPKKYFDPKKSHILIGGLGGVGLELCDWMIKKGATKIVLNSRRTISNGYQSYCLKKWSEFEDVTIKINTDNTAELAAAENLIVEAQKLGPVGGIFNLGLVLRDNPITKQTANDFAEVFKPKIISGQNMDLLSRKLCPELDHFVVFSSLSSGRGNMGQTNYGMANSALERLCEKRRNEKLPGLAIQWGPIGDVGVFTKSEINVKLMEFLLPQPILSCMKTLETMMIHSPIVGSSMILADRSSDTQLQSIKTVVEAVSHILGIKNPDLTDKTLTLTQLGLDSLMLAEIKQILYRNYQMDLSADEIRDLTLNKLISVSGNSNGTDSTSPTGTEINKTPSTFLLQHDTLVNLNTSASKKTVFFLHPLEGHVEEMRHLSKKIDANVFGLQFTKECCFDDMRKIAQFYLQRIRETQTKGPYILCGYSYGASIAFEIGLQLEKSSEKVEIFCIDGSPAFVKSHLNYRFIKNEKSFEKSEIAILNYFAASVPKVNLQKFSKSIESCTDWQQRVKEASKSISQDLGTESEIFSASIEAFKRRLNAAFHYEPIGILKGRITLLRVKTDLYKLSNSYGLDEICEQNVAVTPLEGDHRTILLQNIDIIANIVNNRLKV